MTVTSPTLIRDPWRRLWQAFTSDGFLAIVILVIASLLVVAALLPQTPSSDLVAYSRWLSEAQIRYSSLFEVLNGLGLFSVTHSLLFRVALALLGWCAALRLIDQLDRLRHAAPVQRARRRASLAAALVYGGLLITLSGLVLAAFIDYRVDDLVVQPGVVTPVPGTAYAVRLDAVENQQARVALLRQTETVAQGIVAAKQPLYDGVAVYLDQIGPALQVSATRGPTQTLELQNTATSPLQRQVLLLFTPEQNEGFLAAPAANLVLRVQPVGSGRFSAQAYQSATGKDLGSQSFAPGNGIAVEGTTFTFEPASYVTVSLARQPAHWIIAIGLLLTMVGLLGSLIWPASPAHTRFEHLTQIAARIGWPLITGIWLAWLINIYPQAASLGMNQPLTTALLTLAAWTLASGSVLTQRHIRAILLSLSLVVTVSAVLLLAGNA